MRLMRSCHFSLRHVLHQISVFSRFIEAKVIQVSMPFQIVRCPPALPPKCAGVSFSTSKLLIGNDQQKFDTWSNPSLKLIDVAPFCNKCE